MSENNATNSSEDSTAFLARLSKMERISFSLDFIQDSYCTLVCKDYFEVKSLFHIYYILLYSDLLQIWSELKFYDSHFTTRSPSEA